MISSNAKDYCCEDISNIENYNLAVADDKLWICHHRFGENMGLRSSDLIELGMYYNRPAKELMFVKHSEHCSLHNRGEQNPLFQSGVNNPMFGKHHSTESNEKNRIAHLGKTLSDEVKKKMSDAHKGKKMPERTDEWRRKQSIAHKGRIPWNKGLRKEVL